MSRLVIVDEAHQVLSEAKEGRYDLGDGADLGFMRSARKIGGCTSVILIDQVPSKLNDASIANCSNIICFALVDDRDVRKVGCAAGLAPHQRNELPTLGPRETIVRLERYNKRPLKMEISELKFPPSLSREEARRRSKPILDTMPYTKRTEQQAGEKHGGLVPGSDDYKTFACIVRAPWTLTEDRVAETGLGRDADSRSRGRLETRGLIREEGRVGAKLKLFAPTARGKELALKLGLPVGSTGKGGVAHEAGVRYTQRSIEKACPGVQFYRTGVAATTAGVQPDLLGVGRAGYRVAVQFCYQNRPPYEAAQLLRLHGLTLLGSAHPDRVEWVVAVAANKGHAVSIEKVVRQDNGGAVPVHLIILDFDKVLKGYDWERLFRR